MQPHMNTAPATLGYTLPGDEPSRDTPLLERLAGRRTGTAFAGECRRALGPKNYFHACAEHGADSHGGTCRMCGGTDPRRVAGEWCLTDLIRMHRRRGGRILDALAGLPSGGLAVVNDRAQLRLPIRMRVRGDEALTLGTAIPDADELPLANGLYEDRGEAHHHPSQWRDRVEVSYSGTFDLSLFDPIGNRAAHVVLRKYGYGCRKGGGAKHRFRLHNLKAFAHQKDAMVRLDEWRVVERAFELMHPDFCTDLADKYVRVLPVDINDPALLEALAKARKAAGLDTPAATDGGAVATMAAQIEALVAQVAALTAAKTAPESTTTDGAPRKATCANCGESGHYAKTCPKPKD